MCRSELGGRLTAIHWRRVIPKLNGTNPTQSKQSTLPRSRVLYLDRRFAEPYSISCIVSLLCLRSLKARPAIRRRNQQSRSELLSPQSIAHESIIMSNTQVGGVYQQIILDVVESSRVDFEEGGVDENVLEQLRQVRSIVAIDLFFYPAPTALVDLASRYIPFFLP